MSSDLTIAQLALADLVYDDLGLNTELLAELLPQMLQELASEPGER